MNTEFEKQNIFGLGPENTAFAQYFIGKSYLKPLVEPGKSPIFLANVTPSPIPRKPFSWPTSPLSRAAATTGTSTAPAAAAVKSSSAWLGAAGIRRTENRRGALAPVMSLSFPPT